jgi:hypothetical protein
MGKPLPLTLLGMMNPCHIRDDSGIARKYDTIDTLPTCGGSLCYKFLDGTKVPSAAIENDNLCVAGVAHPVRAIVVELASYDVIQGKPWFTRHNAIVDWRQHRLRLKVDGQSV